MNGKGLLNRKSFIAVVSLALILLFTLPMVSHASPVTIQEQNREQERNRWWIRTETRQARGHNVPVEKGWILNITAMGTAVNITDPSETETAQVIFNATVDKASMGRAKMKVTEGELKIGSTNYTIEKGWGLIALRSGKIIVHLQVIKQPDGAKLHVVLKGRITGSVPSPFDVGSTVDVGFSKPQSKLAGQFFLDLSGTLKRVG